MLMCVYQSNPGDAETDDQIGLSYVLDRQGLITSTAYSLCLPTLKLRCLAADMMGAICLISSSGHQQVLDGLSDTKGVLGENHRFEWLVLSLLAYDPIAEEDESSVWEWRKSALGLINALAGNGDDVESRCEIRGELRRRGLDHALEALMSQEPTQEFLVQAELYQQESKEDHAELRRLNMQYLLPDSLKAVREEDEETDSNGEQAEPEGEAHLGGLYEEISDLRIQVSTQF